MRCCSLTRTHLPSSLTAAGSFSGARRLTTAVAFAQRLHLGSFSKCANDHRRAGKVSAAPWELSIIRNGGPTISARRTFFGLWRRDEVEEDPASFRLPGIIMHPNSFSQYILPDKTAYQRKLSYASLQKEGKSRARKPLELEFGYFWPIRELRNTNDKPILANNKALIPEDKAQVMPRLSVTPMITEKEANVTFPDYLIQNNRLQDPAAQCSVVALCFRDFGYKIIPEWIDPIHEMYADNNRVEVVKMNMTDGGWFFRAMAPFLKPMIFKNTPQNEREYTYLYHGDELALRNFQVKMGFHNVMTCFVILLDGLGRVRWVASGPPNEQELKALLHTHIPQLLPKQQQKTKTVSLIIHKT